MPDPLKVECPHCNGSLKLKDRSFDGKKVRCPKCREIFKIQLPAETEADELEDFADLADDFGGDDFEEEAPAPKPKGGKKAGKKKKKSAGPKIPWGIIGIAAAVLLSIGGLVVVVAQFSGSSGSNKIDMTYLLPDANLVTHFKAQELFTSPLLASVMTQPAVVQMIASQEQQSPVGIKDIISVTVGAKIDQTKSGMDIALGRAPGQAAMTRPVNARQVAVLRTSIPMQPEQIAQAKMHAMPQNHNGKTYYKIGAVLPGAGGYGDSMFFPEPSVMVMAMEADLKEVMDQGPKQIRRREFDFINPGMTVLMAAIIETPLNPNAIVQSPANQPQMQALERAANKTFRGGVAGFKISDRIDIELLMACADSAGAGEMKTAAEAVFTDLKSQFEKMKAMLTLGGMEDVIALGDKSLASIKVEQRGSQIVALGTIPSEIKAVGESLSRKLPGMGGMGMPGGASPTFNGPPGTSGGLPAGAAGIDPSQLPPGAVPTP
ncbi:MAG: zinc-ribbon domain-containing protein [Planctomycetota bacterium]